MAILNFANFSELVDKINTLKQNVSDINTNKEIIESDISKLTDGGKIHSYDVIENDGVYINYMDGLNEVTKKLANDILTIPLLQCLYTANTNGVANLVFKINVNPYKNITLKKYQVGTVGSFSLTGIKDDLSTVTLNSGAPTTETTVNCDITEYKYIQINMATYGGATPYHEVRAYDIIIT